MKISVNESKKIFFGVNGGLPRWMFFNLRRFLLQKHRRMKKFILHCNRFTVVTRYFNLDFVRIKNEGTLGTRLLSKFFFI